MYRHQYKDLVIEVLNDPTYTYASADNNFNYSKHHFSVGPEEYAASKHGVKILRDDEIVESCIIIASGGTTGVYQNSSLVDNDRLVICCCDTVFCLTLPDLELKWKTQADLATCFQIFKLQDDYIVHGEMQISRLDKDGKIKWQFGGEDIFVTIEGEEEFKLAEDHIMLTDFGKTKYKIDFDGSLLWDSYQERKKTGSISDLTKSFWMWLKRL